MSWNLSSALSVIDLDSALLAGTAIIAHQLTQAGDWELTASGANDRPLATVAIRVRGDASSMVAAVELGSAQGEPHPLCGANINTTTNPDTENSFSVRTGGYLRLRAAGVRGGAHALLRRVASSTGEAAADPAAMTPDAAWDSRVLQPGDVFVCMPLRPGRYLLTNELTQARCDVTVRYPDPRSNAGRPSRRPLPVKLHAAQAFTPGTAMLDAGQGLVIDVRTRARLRLTLQQADDGPPDLAAWRVVHEQEVWKRLAARVHAARAAKKTAG